MALEIDSIDELDYGYSSSNYMQPQESRFHDVIFSSANYDERFSRKHAFDTNRQLVDERMETLFRDSFGAETATLKKGKEGKVSGSGEVGVEVTWGGTDKPSYNVSGSAKVKDKDGKYIKLKAEQDNKGEKKLRAEAGKDEKPKQEKKENSKKD